MLLTGVVSPDSSAKGMINKNDSSIACCMVAATDENSSPMPTAASKNTLKPAYSVMNEREWNAKPELRHEQHQGRVNDADKHRRQCLAGHDLNGPERRYQQLIESTLLAFARHRQTGQH